MKRTEEVELEAAHAAGAAAFLRGDRAALADALLRGGQLLFALERMEDAVNTAHHAASLVSEFSAIDHERGPFLPAVADLLDAMVTHALRLRAQGDRAAALGLLREHEAMCGVLSLWAAAFRGAAIEATILMEQRAYREAIPIWQRVISYLRHGGESKLLGYALCEEAECWLRLDYVRELNDWRHGWQDSWLKALPLAREARELLRDDDSPLSKQAKRIVDVCAIAERSQSRRR